MDARGKADPHRRKKRPSVSNSDSDDEPVNKKSKRYNQIPPPSPSPPPSPIKSPSRRTSIPDIPPVERKPTNSGDESENKKSNPNPKSETEPPIKSTYRGTLTPVERTPTSNTTTVGGTTDSVFIGPGPTPRALDFSSDSGMALRVSEEMINGEYSLKLTRVPSNNPRTEHAQAAAMLMSQGDILRKLGENLLSHLGMSYESEIYRSLKL